MASIWRRCCILLLQNSVVWPAGQRRCHVDCRWLCTEYCATHLYPAPLSPIDDKAAVCPKSSCGNAPVLMACPASDAGKRTPPLCNHCPHREYDNECRPSQNIDPARHHCDTCRWAEVNTAFSALSCGGIFEEAAKRFSKPRVALPLFLAYFHACCKHVAGVCNPRTGLFPAYPMNRNSFGQYANK